MCFLLISTHFQKKKGYPGMPEVGNMPLPKKLLEKGIKDMIRISDAR